LSGTRPFLAKEAEARSGISLNSLSTVGESEEDNVLLAAAVHTNPHVAATAAAVLRELRMQQRLSADMLLSARWPATLSVRARKQVTAFLFYFGFQLIHH
jgi:hypothetical protein